MLHNSTSQRSVNGSVVGNHCFNMTLIETLVGIVIAACQRPEKCCRFNYCHPMHLVVTFLSKVIVKEKSGHYNGRINL